MGLLIGLRFHYFIKIGFWMRSKNSTASEKLGAPLPWCASSSVRRRGRLPQLFCVALLPSSRSPPSLSTLLPFPPPLSLPLLPPLLLLFLLFLVLGRCCYLLRLLLLLLLPLFLLLLLLLFVCPSVVFPCWVLLSTALFLTSHSAALGGRAILAAAGGVGGGAGINININKTTTILTHEQQQNHTKQKTTTTSYSSLRMWRTFRATPKPCRAPT